MVRQRPLGWQSSCNSRTTSAPGVVATVGVGVAVRAVDVGVSVGVAVTPVTVATGEGVIAPIWTGLLNTAGQKT